MEQKFNYKPKFNFADFAWLVFMGILFFAFPFIYPFSIALGDFTLVPYPWTIYLCIAVGLLILWSFLSKLKKANKLKNHDCTITVNDRKVSFKELVKGEVKDITVDIADVENAKYDDGELAITMKDGKSYDFDEKYFDDEEEFKIFTTLFNK